MPCAPTGTPLAPAASVSHFGASDTRGCIEPQSTRWLRWRPTDAARLARSEGLMLEGLRYHQEFVAGLNTISNVEFRRGAAAGGGGRDVMVLLHGFAGGLACWAQNWEFFSAHYELYAIDLPGFGRSERPCVKVDSLEGSMGFICGYMERWFCEMSFGRPVILLGHSFGGFVAAHYAMRHGPSRVKVLALAEPWGVNDADPGRIERAPVHYRLALKVFYAAKPLSLLRAVGPAGPTFFRLVRPDFANRWRGFLANPQVFYDYTYHCNAQLPPLGETLFKACCHADVAAKTPLAAVLPKGLSRAIPLVVVYGSHTWLNAECGFTMVDKMAAGGHQARADTVMNAGHQVFTDNVDAFHEKMLQLIRDVLRAGEPPSHHDARCNGTALPRVSCGFEQRGHVGGAVQDEGGNTASHGGA
ncbi:putative monoglyceride lipase [Trypanosoma rangeli]|uniref:Putative monoglyceride lipase n=1 Tax=Trypanosoma rangeli TaxID=5698 RepID=A0A422NW44_TRYRA|nr:putative monoglyceride lipase [Trypanosoma rangeli]RNF09658.1 putative monoglyceride lipase [Trypanosoma rangeli]|eukprot:RNF09658.1 putative monoglyceride lipase [Trypanosoma rangeli]